MTVFSKLNITVFEKYPFIRYVSFNFYDMFKKYHC